MEAYGAIDPQSSQETRLTNEEAQAVIGLWSLQRRLSEDALSRPSVSDIAESLNIPHDEVRKYLELARANQKAGLRTPRSLKADLALAFAALAVLAFIAFCLSAFFVTRRQIYPTPAYTMSNFTPLPATPGYSAQVPRSALIGYSNNPKRLVIGVGSTLVTPRQSVTGLNDDFVRQSIQAAVGGPMADRSVLNNRSFAQVEVNRVISAGPVENSPILDWKRVQVAFGGKMVEAYFPFSKIADKNARVAVEAEHARLIGGLVESVLSQVRK